MHAADGPLAGIRVVEFESIGPGPFAAMLLAGLGADVLRIARPPADTALDTSVAALQRGRPALPLDLRRDEHRRSAWALVERADVLLEGARPGVMERRGFGPADCHARNPRLVYARMTGWGQDGPLAARAGHDLNYIALTGVLHSCARTGQPPTPPLNLVGDFGGGAMPLLVGILAALLERQQSGRGQVVDAAMVDGSALLMTIIYGLRAQGRWADEAGTNLLDGGAPFYDVYATADDRYVAVAALEPQFFQQLLAGLELDPDQLPDQYDRSGWPRLRQVLAEVFRTRTRQEWEQRFHDLDACVTPVLDLAEAPQHPHLRARDTFPPGPGGQPLPGAAPRFSRTPGPSLDHPARADARATLARWGLDPDQLTG